MNGWKHQCNNLDALNFSEFWWNEMDFFYQDQQNENIVIIFGILAKFSVFLVRSMEMLISAGVKTSRMIKPSRDNAGTYAISNVNSSNSSFIFL